MNDFGIMWTKIKIYLYLCMDVLSKTPFMYINMYLITGEDTIMF